MFVSCVFRFMFAFALLISNVVLFGLMFCVFVYCVLRAVVCCNVDIALFVLIVLCSCLYCLFCYCFACCLCLRFCFFVLL